MTPDRTGNPTAGEPGDATIRLEPLPMVTAVFTEVARTVGSAVKPEAATAVAQTFGFPLALMLAVLLFLLVQSRLDDRDPKLRRAPLTGAETTILFVNEADL